MRYIETFITIIYIDFNRINCSLYIFLMLTLCTPYPFIENVFISFNTENSHFSPQDSTLVLSHYLTEVCMSIKLSY